MSVLACLFVLLCICLSATRAAPIRGSVRRHDDASLLEAAFEKRRLKMDMKKKQKEQASSAPTGSPTASVPTPEPTSSPTRNTTGITYSPGDFSQGKKSQDGLLNLSNGLSCKRIATTGVEVALADDSTSLEKFHDQPDGAAVFEKQDGSGWYYVSNAENNRTGDTWEDGGVGSIEFNALGQVTGYQKIVHHTRQNCGGGVTPWGTWITAEEMKLDDIGWAGKLWQVDPSGTRPHEETALGSLGWYESFAFDESTAVPTAYVTRDSSYGVLTRFTPDAQGMACYNQTLPEDRWCTLNHGTKDYLMISGGPSGTFQWTTDYGAARDNANDYYPNAEGIDAVEGKVFFVSKKLKRLVILDLHTQEYTYGSTESGAFNHSPDQVARLVKTDESILYFCEDGGPRSGVFGRTASGDYFTVLEGDTNVLEDEATGLSFCPNGEHMYVTYQEAGYVYDCTRDDGLPFNGAILDIKYHATE